MTLLGKDIQIKQQKCGLNHFTFYFGKKVKLHTANFNLGQLLLLMTFMKNQG